ncbi:rhodanese-like domain-containing protein [Paenibacillus alginolyticus]|uniref:Rhodanese-like domain-containing protein n=1 Tax=Paenibacillus alginolyticus TaxID=59839 RepID=A0ABT4G5S0_9BACL|nr:rhodanese-like domain-containing protein [Paenibacillus alginolyticus]MCY9669942.1 rhodanese-like domain-containing protein [Paenibacillus alginolyticus]MCY9691521.1 rhodanese-like domain-containing protein [Paenibacillus alginolyticus]MEC0148316.1 rhodanese-like domain-containing protein [Paenibacillus alginolyticus]
MDYTSIFNIVALAFLVWFIYSRFASLKGLNNLSPDQFQEELKGKRNYVLIDVREPGEVKQGYIPGAINIPLSHMKQKVGEIQKNNHVYLYCRSGMRSKQAARILKKNGFNELSHLQGGIMSWKGKLTK